ncbi:hypothetical protein [Xanthomonas arboricola]|uniref:hypothetical protein n=1 Tax=Xanthomonas arboricola TaxID=56448 RepID=UPI000F8D3118|nr:hypothetical protein [Xanthomonas arboricola]
MPVFTRTTKETKELAERLYFDIQEELFRRETLNSEAYDKAILTYSSGALALSLGFLKDFALRANTTHLTLLFVSWCLFVLAIFSTTLSFILGKFATVKQLEKAELYYIHGHSPAIDTPNKWAGRANIANWTSGLAFTAAALLTAVFVFVSLKDKNMSHNDPRPGVVEKIISGQTDIIKSVDPTRMVRLPEPVDPAPAPAPAEPASGSTPSSAP